MLSVELGLLSLGFTSQIRWRWRDSPVFAVPEGKLSAHPEEGAAAAAWAQPSRGACCCPRVGATVSVGQQYLVLHRATGHFPPFLRVWDFK